MIDYIAYLIRQYGYWQYVLAWATGVALLGCFVYWLETCRRYYY